MKQYEDYEVQTTIYVNTIEPARETKAHDQEPTFEGNCTDYKSMNFNVAQKHESPSDHQSVQIPKTEVLSLTCILGWRLILLHKLSIAQIHTAYGRGFRTWIS